VKPDRARDESAQLDTQTVIAELCQYRLRAWKWFTAYATVWAVGVSSVGVGLAVRSGAGWVCWLVGVCCAAFFVFPYLGVREVVRWRKTTRYWREREAREAS
jgi:hypothetical protein